MSSFFLIQDSKVYVQGSKNYEDFYTCRLFYGYQLLCWKIYTNVLCGLNYESIPSLLRLKSLVPLRAQNELNFSIDPKTKFHVFLGDKSF
jgi:hypothetical protein